MFVGRANGSFNQEKSEVVPFCPTFRLIKEDVSDISFSSKSETKDNHHFNKWSDIKVVWSHTVNIFGFN